MQRTFWKSAAIIIIICIAIGFFIWYEFIERSAQTPTGSVYTNLISVNPAFAQADAFFKAGQYAQAYPEYEIALQSAQNPAQEGNIKLKAAYSYEEMNGGADHLASIPMFKEIAADTSYTSITRAYAVQELGNIFYRYADTQATTAIFSDAPYQSMYVAGNIPLSYRHLYEYSASLYPLSVSELRVANWYASSIQKLSAMPVTASTTAQIATYKNIIRQNLTSADQDITRITGTAEATAVPSAVQLKAVISARLASVGDTSFGDWEALFRQDLTLLSSYNQPGLDGFSRYLYAEWLARIDGATRSSDIQNLLAPFYTGDQYTQAPVTVFFTNEKNNVVGSKASLVQLALIDPKFKAYLISLGWQESDFSSPTTTK